MQLPGIGHPQFASQYTGGKGGVYRSIFVMRDGDRIEERLRNRIAPACITLFDIKEQYSEAELQSRRLAIKKAFTDNSDGPLSNLTYLEEAYYFVPIYLALQLQRRGQYTAALDYFRSVYDYSAPAEERKIYYRLKDEEDYQSTFEGVSDWLLDPLYPHAIAAARKNAYTRFTLLSLVHILLEYADAEFTLDTTESTARARRLYMTALELLKTPELQQKLGECDEMIDTIVIRVGDDEKVWEPVVDVMKKEIRGIPDPGRRATVISSVKEVLAMDESLGKRLARARVIIADVRGTLPGPATMATVIKSQEMMLSKAHAALLTQKAIFKTYDQVGINTGKDFSRTVSLVTGIETKTLDEKNPDLPWLRSPSRDATGLFELTMQPQSREMLFPFEGMGVDTAWEFTLPKAANLFDYAAIADVLFTLEYTALNSFSYRRQVITVGS